MAEPLISARSIVRRFGEMPVLHSLDIDLQPGEFCAITGKSGAGIHAAGHSWHPGHEVRRYPHHKGNRCEEVLLR